MSYNYLPLDRKHTSLQQIKNLLAHDQHISISFDAHDRIVKCRAYLDKKIANKDANYYGVNTGFGFLQNTHIADDRLNELQNNLILSHACGTGNEIREDIVKLMLAFKIKSLAYGHSGVQIDTVNRLMDMYNAGIFPVIYSQGSLGASGDLAPLSHLSLPLLGLGEVRYKGEKKSSESVLKELGWSPIALQSKEGIALINGTQFMSAHGMYILLQCERLMQWANVIAALSYDAFDCNKDPLHKKLHSIRSHKGQVAVALTLNKILAGSEILSQGKKQVQDPYSFRCIPQVHGATQDVIEHVENIFVKEINSVTDNPNIFPDEDLILSGGNFHGQPLAMAADYLSIAMSELGSISERRTFQLISGQRDLPMFLIKNPGVHSGLMIPQYTAASIVSENKTLCTPSSVDTISSSNNQEDHVSMGANAVVKCLTVVENVEKVLAIELLTSMQAMDFREEKTSSYLQKIKDDYRTMVSFNEADRMLYKDMQATVDFIKSYKLPKPY